MIATPGTPPIQRFLLHRAAIGLDTAVLYLTAGRGGVTACLLPARALRDRSIRRESSETLACFVKSVIERRACAAENSVARGGSK